MTDLILFADAIGILVGVEFVLIAFGLTFRARYIDGFVYPWQLSATCFLAGTLLIFYVESRSGYISVGRPAIAMVLFLILGAIGVVLQYYLWFIYPKNRDPEPCLIQARRRERND